MKKEVIALRASLARQEGQVLKQLARRALDAAAELSALGDSAMSAYEAAKAAAAEGNVKAAQEAVEDAKAAARSAEERVAYLQDLRSTMLEMEASLAERVSEMESALPRAGDSTRRALERAIASSKALGWACANAADKVTASLEHKNWATACYQLARKEAAKASKKAKN